MAKIQSYGVVSTRGGRAAPLDVANQRRALGDLVRNCEFEYTANMVSTLPTIRRLTALVLPICFLCLFVTCVTICSMDTGEKGLTEEIGNSTPAYRVLPEESECCIDGGQRSVLFERFAFGVTIERAGNQASIPRPRLTLALIHHTPFGRSTSDPPSALLLPLRI